MGGFNVFNGVVLGDFPVPSGSLIVGVTVTTDRIIISSAGQSSVSASDNVFYRYTLSGVFVDSVNQNTPGTGWGLRDLAFDGTYIYGGHEGSRIKRYNPATLTLVDSVLINTGQSIHRGIAVIPGENALYTSNFNDAPVLKINSTNAATIRELGTPQVAPYGMAFDNFNNPQRGYLWISEPSLLGFFRLTRLDTATGLKDISFDFSSIYPNSTSGGLAIINNHPQYPGKVVALMVKQGSPQKIVLVDITLTAPNPPQNVNAIYNQGSNTINVNWSNPKTGLNGLPVTVDSSVIFVNGVREGVVPGNDSNYTKVNPQNGLYLFGVQVFASGSGSTVVNSGYVPVGLYSYSYTRTFVNKPINDNQTTLDTLRVPPVLAPITKIILRIDTIIHSFVADLDISLIAPDGFSLDISSDNGGAGENYIQTVFDDEAAISITQGNAPFTGTFRPETPLTSVYGSSALGVWVLSVFDDAYGDSGRLYSWGITVLTSEPVPVELQNFSIQTNGSGVTLSWETVSETNNAGFEIQRRKENGEFVKAGFVQGAGTTTEIRKYYFSEKNLSPGVYYYRLKQTDFDGTSVYSQEIEINVDVPVNFLVSQNYPNPVSLTENSIMSSRVNFSLPSNAFVTISIYDALGSLIKSPVNSFFEAGAFEVDLELSNFASGSYFYRVEARTETGEIYFSTKKLTVVK
ncbi:MAG: proprotein convertase P-domain-containing protein [Ignavibacteriaceae bacterium]|nr:proprotein convertase P-domain-containing protein [Ignavibacteriaceae bacterium]